PYVPPSSLGRPASVSPHPHVRENGIFCLVAEIVNYEFDTKDLVCLAVSSVVGVWYLLRKHWIANNLFGLAFSLNGVELLHLNNVSTGCILLGGLFIYDVFWVFGTNVMDLLEKGLEADNFAMLGLGDIVIPGIFIALLLRFDISLKKNTHTHAYTSFVAYIFGLSVTIFIMHVFKHAQPALFYESSAEILPHTPRLTHFPNVSGSPSSLADSMQQSPACSHRRRQQSASVIYEENTTPKEAKEDPKEEMTETDPEKKEK
ncbi:putative Minor histocompatibility antigen H13 protein, partial [Naja naja]